MKHNTHIYLALKAVDLIRQSVDNMVDKSGKYIKGKAKAAERRDSKERRRILDYYRDLTAEASWAPDDILKDNDPNHIFKLYTKKEFPGHKPDKNKPKFEKDGKVFYKFAGGLPYRVDHIVRSIGAMQKLRSYNDQFDLKQIMYKYLLLSHYVVDAHVPMHCDLRDDPPSQGKHTDPSRRKGGKGKPDGKYMDGSAHGKLEQLWDGAVTPVAIDEGIISRTWVKEKVDKSAYSDAVSFGLADCKKGGDVVVRKIRPNGLMDFMIDVCLTSKMRGQELFPLENPKERRDDILEDVTRRIFADCLGNLMSIWRHIWTNT